MTTMNLYPFYEKLIQNKMKFTSVRLGNQLAKYAVGTKIEITIGWQESLSNPIVGRAIIINVKTKKIEEIVNSDLEGESPDCLSKEQLKYVLSSIYRRIVSDKDEVTIVRWKYID